MQLSSSNFEYLEIGVDEAGRGPLLGRVYAAAVILPNDPNLRTELIKDSKKFTSTRKIHESAEYIKQHAIAYSIQYCDEHVIDTINILNATQEAMHKCIFDIYEKINRSSTDLLVLVDGNYFKPIFVTNTSKTTLEPINFKTVIKGDATYYSIAAASILAKVARDDYIDELCDQHPDLDEKYSLRTNKGYGTKSHLQGIETHGVCEFHRKSFKRCH